MTCKLGCMLRQTPTLWIRCGEISLTEKFINYCVEKLMTQFYIYCVCVCVVQWDMLLMVMFINSAIKPQIQQAIHCTHVFNKPFHKQCLT